MAVLRLFGSTIQNGKTLLNARSLWIANCRMTSAKFGDLIIYASNYNTHLDFLIINKVSKQPVLAIETDGYSYHNDETEQHQRDMMKDHILSNYGLPLLRLSTKGSGEREKIISSLNKVVC